VPPRFGTNVTDFDRLIVRGGLGWGFGPGLSVWLGYDWTPNLTLFRDEQRPFQQFLGETRLGAVALVNRTRLEQRFIGDTGGVSLRARHLVRGVRGLVPELPWLRVALSEGLFMNLNGVTNGLAAGLDQNRAFVGLNFAVNEVLQLEAGYLSRRRPALRGRPREPRGPAHGHLHGAVARRARSAPALEAGARAPGGARALVGARWQLRGPLETADNPGQWRRNLPSRGSRCCST
jgi:hypothetical protein